MLGNRVPETAAPRLIYAQIEGRPTTFSVPAELVQPLFDAQVSLREKRFFPVYPASVNSLVIAIDDQEINLQRLENSSWQVIYENAAGDPQRQGQC